MKLCGIPEPTTIPPCPMSDQSVKADYIVLKQLSKVGSFFAGFLDKALERKEEEDK